MSRYAGVYLLDAPYAIDKPYDYLVSEAWEDRVTPGRFVAVPFGGGNRHRFGVVVSLAEQSDVTNVKPILSVCEEPLSLSDEMLALCLYMKEQLLCTFGDAVRAMIPAAAMSRLRDYYVLGKGKALPKSLQGHDGACALLDMLRRRESVDVQTAARIACEGSARVLQKMERAGLLSRVSRVETATNEKTRVLLRPAKPTEELRRMLADEPPLPGGSARKLTPRQKDVLSAVLDAAGSGEEAAEVEEVEESVVLAQSGGTAAQVKALIGRGLLVRREERVMRDPYAALRGEKKEFVLSDEQAAAYERLCALSRDGQAHAALLFGVTGSGKTSVMLHLIDDVLARGRSAIVLLPEIALTPQSLTLFCARYGERVAVIHSGLSAGERYDAFTRIKRGEATVVVGTRSAVFAPVASLGLIIIDEEQEHTYKSDMDPKYHARDIARFRCAKQNALLLLASATPSLESYYKTQTGKYTLVKLANRFGGAKLPEVTIADMRAEAGMGNTSPLGGVLTEELLETAKQRQQSILFLNRRGYHTHTVCKKCGETLRCPHCSVSLTYHTQKGTYNHGFLVCHWCGYRAPMPETCPSCGSDKLVREGYGTQRVEQELGALSPDIRVLRMDTDTTSGKFAYDTLLSRFRAHEADVLLGTQMVTKGHDFPDVTLVGVLSADASLYLDDYRAAEKTFAMLTQVIGRAGRGEKPGRAVIQTNNPDSDVIRMACLQNYEEFYRREIKLRKLLSFPPFCDIVLLTLSGAYEPSLLEATTSLARRYRELAAESGLAERQIAYGPFEAPVYRVDNRYRMRMVIKCVLNRESRALFSRILSEFTSQGRQKSNPVTLSIDFNPSSL